MRTTQMVFGVLLLIAWAAVSGFSIYSLANTTHLSDAAAPLAGHLGHTWNSDSWAEHWLFHNSYTLTCGLIGCVGAVLLIRATPAGFLAEAIATLLWFLLPYSLEIFGLRRFGYEFVNLQSNLQLLAFCIAFVIGYFVCKRKEQSTTA
jgi:hypothetical protein